MWLIVQIGLARNWIFLFTDCRRLNKREVNGSLQFAERSGIQTSGFVQTCPHTTTTSIGVVVTLISPTNPILKYDQKVRPWTTGSLATHKGCCRVQLPLIFFWSLWVFVLVSLFAALYAAILQDVLPFSKQLGGGFQERSDVCAHPLLKYHIT